MHSGWLGCVVVPREHFGAKRVTGRVDRGYSGDNEPAHVLKSDQVLGRVATMGTRLMGGWTEPVPAVPRS